MKPKFIVLLSTTFRMYSFHGVLKLDWTITVFTQLRFCPMCISPNYMLQTFATPDQVLVC